MQHTRGQIQETDAPTAKLASQPVARQQDLFWPPAGREVPLSQVPSSTKVTVIEIIGADESRRRLRELGLFAGAQVEVAANSAGTPLIVKIDQSSRLAIDRHLAETVQVICTDI